MPISKNDNTDPIDWSKGVPVGGTFTSGTLHATALTSNNNTPPQEPVDSDAAWKKEVEDRLARLEHHTGFRGISFKPLPPFVEPATASNNNTTPPQEPVDS
jgi:hypothetical protein